MRPTGRGALLAAMSLVASLCHGSPLFAQARYDQFRIIAPAAPGGGWDQTARAMQVAMQTAGLARVAPVENIPGAAGTIGLARFMGAERANDNAVLVSGLIMLGGIVMHRSQVTLRDVVPIARISGEYEVIAVAAASPYRTLRDLLDAFVARPESISWGGGSAGGSDQMLAGLVADAVGVNPRRVNYIAFSGGGESLAAILGGQVSAGINGLAEFAPHIESGSIRVLAISSGTRLPSLDAPTLRESGVDVEFENWRSLVAPPGISPADRRRLDAVVAAMVRSPEWRETLARFRWLDRYQAGKDFAMFAAAEEVRVRGILRELGTGQEIGSLESAGPYPIFVLAGLAFFGVAALRTLRFVPRPADASRLKLRSISMIVIGAVLNLALTERAGFFIASAVLFWFVARAFDERHPARDAAFALAVSLAAYLLFARVLQLQLPAGVFAGIAVGGA